MPLLVHARTATTDTTTVTPQLTPQLAPMHGPPCPGLSKKSTKCIVPAGARSHALA